MKLAIQKLLLIYRVFRLYVPIHVQITVERLHHKLQQGVQVAKLFCRQLHQLNAYLLLDDQVLTNSFFHHS
jgi:hypothetical protein